MFFLNLVEVALVVIMWAGLITQVFWPVITGRPIFPLFLTDRREAEKKLTTARERVDVRAIHREVKQVNKEQ